MSYFLRRGFALPHLLLALAAVAIIATAIVYTTQRLGSKPVMTNQTVVTNNGANANATTNSNAVANINATTNSNAAVNTNVAATADWKTYINSTYRYSLKYPAGWVTVDDTGRVIPIPDTSTNMTEWFNFPIRGSDPPSITVIVREGSSAAEAMESWKKKYAATETSASIAGQRWEKLVFEKK